MRYFVEVSFSIPIGDGTLTYHFDSDKDIPEVGCRAIVTVQGRKIIGYITKVHTTKPEFRTLALKEILDPLPLFSKAMVELAFKVANDCVCNPGEVLHAMLPGGIKQKINRFVQKTEHTDPNLHPALNFLCDKEKVAYSTFKSEFPTVASKASEWLETKQIELIHLVSKSAGPKFIKVLEVNQEIPINIEELTAKEKLVAEFLLRGNSSLTAAVIRKAINVSISPINQLKKKGILIEREERVMREVAQEEYYQREATPPPELSDDQKKVLSSLEQAFSTDKKPVLVRGVTCSGKTEVYLRWVAEIIKTGKSAIVLVPEISLTPQMMKRFKDRFQSKVAILHSKLSKGERFDQWEQIRRGNCPVVVGARSAVFAPVPNLGTIILDEEGEPSFKQADSPRYHAREVARIRCQLENSLLVMGSATPTLDAFFSCKQNKFHLVEMNQRVSDRKPPKVQIVDMREELTTRKNRSMFSKALSESLKDTLSKKQQAILFLNRRGYSSFIFCRECGEPIQCTKCNVSMVYHAGSRILRCHYCGEIKEIPSICPQCNSKAIKFFGAGTQRVEAETRRYFPYARVQRLDSDTVGPKGNMEEILDAFGQGKIDVLIGTQMVAKGLDFPNVTLVGILAADSLLRVPDFRAAERNFALLAQVSGRAGRGEHPGKVVLQTYYPDHHSIKFALTEDYYGFYDAETQNRKETNFPPFTEIASFIISSVDMEKAQQTSRALSQNLKATKLLSDELILGPVPAAIERLNGKFRFQLLVKSASLDKLTSAVKQALTNLKKTSNTKVTVDINPYFML